MAMEKSVLQAMLGALPDDKLMAALQYVMGQNSNGASMDNTGSVLGGMSVDNKIQPWNDRQITFGGEDPSRPPLVDKKWIAPKNVEPPQGQGPMSVNSGAGQTNPFLQSGGGM